MRTATFVLAFGVLASSNGWTARAALIMPSPPGADIPVCVAVDLLSGKEGRGASASAGPQQLRGTIAGRSNSAAWQFEADSAGSHRGRIWHLTLASPAKPQLSKPGIFASASNSSLAITADPAKLNYTIMDGQFPVLRYNQGTVPVPAGVGTNYARGDYIMPLYGLHGEVLTDDYPKDHPHHRGIGWSWPVTRWGNEVRDIWAVRGVWARPLAMRRTEVGPVFALLDAENVWKWGDTNAIVREEVLIRAFARSAKGRFVDVEVRLTALADGVAIGGRPKGAYGGFGLRAQPAEQRTITLHTDPPARQPRRSWLDYTGAFAGGRGLTGITIFEHVANLYYPNTLLEYPKLNYVMPAFPGDREMPLTKDKPLVLRHRLWIHDGAVSEPELTDVWTVYSTPPIPSTKASDQNLP